MSTARKIHKAILIRAITLTLVIVFTVNSALWACPDTLRAVRNAEVTKSPAKKKTWERTPASGPILAAFRVLTKARQVRRHPGRAYTIEEIEALIKRTPGAAKQIVRALVQLELLDEIEQGYRVPARVLEHKEEIRGHLVPFKGKNMARPNWAQLQEARRGIEDIFLKVYSVDGPEYPLPDREFIKKVTTKKRLNKKEQQKVKAIIAYFWRHEGWASLADLAFVTDAGDGNAPTVAASDEELRKATGLDLIDLESLRRESMAIEQPVPLLYSKTIEKKRYLRIIGICEDLGWRASVYEIGTALGLVVANRGTINSMFSRFGNAEAVAAFFDDINYNRQLVKKIQIEIFFAKETKEAQDRLINALEAFDGRASAAELAAILKINPRNVRVTDKQIDYKGLNEKRRAQGKIPLIGISHERSKMNEDEIIHALEILGGVASVDQIVRQSGQQRVTTQRVLRKMDFALINEIRQAKGLFPLFLLRQHSSIKDAQKIITPAACRRAQKSEVAEHLIQLYKDRFGKKGLSAFRNVTVPFAYSVIYQNGANGSGNKLSPEEFLLREMQFQRLLMAALDWFDRFVVFDATKFFRRPIVLSPDTGLTSYFTYVVPRALNVNRAALTEWRNGVAPAPLGNIRELSSGEEAPFALSLNGPLTKLIVDLRRISALFMETRFLMMYPYPANWTHGGIDYSQDSIVFDWDKKIAQARRNYKRIHQASWMWFDRYAKRQAPQAQTNGKTGGKYDNTIRKAGLKSGERRFHSQHSAPRAGGVPAAMLCGMVQRAIDDYDISGVQEYIREWPNQVTTVHNELKTQAKRAIKAKQYRRAIAVAMYMIKMGDLDSAHTYYVQLDELEGSNPTALNGNRRLLAVLRVQVGNAKQRAKEPFAPAKSSKLNSLLGKSAKIYDAKVGDRVINLLELAARGLLPDEKTVEERFLVPQATILPGALPNKPYFPIGQAASLSGRESPEDLYGIPWIDIKSRNGREEVSREDVQLLISYITAEEAHRYIGISECSASGMIDSGSLKGKTLERKRKIKGKSTIAVRRDSAVTYADTNRLKVPMNAAFKVLSELYNDKAINITIGEDCMKQVALHTALYFQEESRIHFGNIDSIAIDGGTNKDKLISLWDIQTVAELIQAEVYMRSRAAQYSRNPRWMILREVEEATGETNALALQKAIKAGRCEAIAPEEVFFVRSGKRRCHYLLPNKALPAVKRGDAIEERKGGLRDKNELIRQNMVVEINGEEINAFDQAMAGTLSQEVYEELERDFYPAAELDEKKYYSSKELEVISNRLGRPFKAQYWLRKIHEGFFRERSEWKLAGGRYEITGSSARRVLDFISARTVREDFGEAKVESLFAFAKAFGEEDAHERDGVRYISIRAANRYARFQRSVASVPMIYDNMSMCLQKESKLNVGMHGLRNVIDDPESFFGNARRVKVIFGHNEPVNFMKKHPEFVHVNKGSMKIAINLMDLSFLAKEIKRQDALWSRSKVKRHEEVAEMLKLCRRKQYEMRALAVDGWLGCDLVDFIGNSTHTQPVFNDKRIKILTLAWAAYNRTEEFECNIIKVNNFVEMMNRLRRIYVFAPERFDKLLAQHVDDLGAKYQLAIRDAVKHWKPAKTKEQVELTKEELLAQRGFSILEQTGYYTDFYTQTVSLSNGFTLTNHLPAKDIAMFTQFLWILYLMPKESEGVKPPRNITKICPIAALTREKFLQLYAQDVDVKALLSLTDKLGEQQTTQEQRPAVAASLKILSNAQARAILSKYADVCIKATFAEIRGPDYYRHIDEIARLKFDWKNGYNPEVFRSFNLGRRFLRKEPRLEISRFNSAEKTTRDFLRKRFHEDLQTGRAIKRRNHVDEIVAAPLDDDFIVKNGTKRSP